MRDADEPTALEITVVEAGPEAQPLLHRLMELCQHDYSELNGADVDEHGCFGYRYLERYWREPGRYPFLVRVSGKSAGFVLVRELERNADGQPVHEVAEFFILRKYRRRGIGQAVAQQVFARFPGVWQLRVEANNQPAQAFWQVVVGRCGHGDVRAWIEERSGDRVYQFCTNVAHLP
jgi:predicted acetyltransferase